MVEATDRMRTTLSAASVTKTLPSALTATTWPPVLSESIATVSTTLPLAVSITDIELPPVLATYIRVSPGAVLIAIVVGLVPTGMDATVRRPVRYPSAWGDARVSCCDRRSRRTGSAVSEYCKVRVRALNQHR